GLPGHEDVAGPIRGDPDGVDAVVTVAAEERRPVETGVDDERERRVAARHDEAVPVRVDDPEVADERLPRAVGPHLPRDGPRLSPHPDPRLQLERSVVSDGERGHPASANDDLAEVSVWRNEDVVLQAGDVIAPAPVDPALQPPAQNP